MIGDVPPANPATFNPVGYALATSINDMLATVAATNGTNTECGLSFMQSVDSTNLGMLMQRGAKVMVYHGISDAIFSVNDTTTWYEGPRTANSSDASNFARFFRVPGMAHCAVGPLTDQFDILTPLVN